MRLESPSDAVHFAVVPKKLIEITPRNCLVRHQINARSLSYTNENAIILFGRQKLSDKKQQLVGNTRRRRVHFGFVRISFKCSFKNAIWFGTLFPIAHTNGIIRKVFFCWFI